jgi:hypothetical protein
MSHPGQPRAEELREDRDPGLVVERTNLAWSRSGLAVLACLGVLARRFFPLDTRTDSLAAFALLAAGGGGWALGLLLSRRGGPPPAIGGHAGARRLRIATGSTLALAVAAFILGLFPPT